MGILVSMGQSCAKLAYAHYKKIQILSLLDAEI